MIKKIELEMTKLSQRTLVYPWENQMAYMQFLAQTYYYTRQSTRLLALTASRLDVSQEKVHQRFLRHITEENSHEKLALRDLKYLGGNINNYPELVPVKLFYQHQQYYIDRLSPWAFFGYILALEGLSVLCGKQIYFRCNSLYGEEACAFLRVHVGEDEKHVEEAKAIVYSLDIALQKQILESLVSSSYLFSLALNEMQSLSQVEKMSFKKAV